MVRIICWNHRIFPFADLWETVCRGQSPPPVLCSVPDSGGLYRIPVSAPSGVPENERASDPLSPLICIALFNVGL